MNASTLQLIQVCFQALSSTAIAGGFIYAAFQFRQAQKAAHVANFTRLVELQMSLRKMRVDDPSLAAVYAHDIEGLSSDREIREHFFNLMQLSVFEIVWFSYHRGQIPRDYFESWAVRMRDVAAEPSFRRMMSGRQMKIMHDEFQAYMLKMLEEVPERAPPARQPA